jgi:regulatory protein
MRKKRPKPGENAKESALRLLALRDHSREEVRCKLRAKGFDREEIEEALQTLEMRGILDDGRYAQRLAFYLAQEKLFGPQRISQKLFQKGIPADLIQQAMGKAEEGLATNARLRVVLGMKLKGRRLEQIFPNERRKLANYLRQRGFSWEDIQEAFQEAGGFTEKG